MREGRERKKGKENKSGWEVGDGVQGGYLLLQLFVLLEFPGWVGIYMWYY